jgi:hypothetical protein
VRYHQESAQFGSTKGDESIFRNRVIGIGARCGQGVTVQRSGFFNQQSTINNPKGLFVIRYPFLVIRPSSPLPRPSAFGIHQSTINNQQSKVPYSV